MVCFRIITSVNAGCAGFGVQTLTVSGLSLIHIYLGQKHDPTALISYMATELFVTPLDLLARAASRPDVKSETARALFDNYDGFLTLLDNLSLIHI